MASRVQINTGKFAGVSIFDVDHTVGYGATNRTDDVLLVQFLLKGYFRGHNTPPLGQLAVDGIFGPLTHYWSLFFFHSIKGFYETRGQRLDFKEVGNVGSFRRLSGQGLDSTMIGQLNAQFLHRMGASYDFGTDSTLPGQLRERWAQDAVMFPPSARPVVSDQTALSLGLRG